MDKKLSNLAISGLRLLVVVAILVANQPAVAEGLGVDSSTNSACMATGLESMVCAIYLPALQQVDPAEDSNPNLPNLKTETDPSTESGTDPIVDLEAGNGWLGQLFTTTHVVQFFVLLVGVWIGTSIAMSGQQGWGWRIVTVLTFVVMAIGKGLLGIFMEVTNESCSDWDE